MAYVAVKGGKKAIDESLKRLKYERLKGRQVLSTKSIESGMRLLIDYVMSEASLYSPEIAALAIKQAEGSMEEAVFLLRAYRSTLPRRYYTEIVDTRLMQVERRISAAFKDIPEGQWLGASYDYSHRLLDFDLKKENKARIRKFLSEFDHQVETPDLLAQSILTLPKVSDYLRDIGFMDQKESNLMEPDDITKKSLSFPTTRSQRLQSLTRGMTQAVTALGYASLRGYGSVHPTVGELRVGQCELFLSVNGENEEDQYCIGEIKITEVESFVPTVKTMGYEGSEIQFDIGYGCVFGQNETKAIAMSILDRTLESKDSDFATSDEEFVLYHIDSVEATGFISHLKLPHYVTFQAKLNSARKVKEKQNHETKI